MAFAGMNYLAIVIAAVAAWVAGAAWYTVLAKPWMTALGKTPAEIEACKNQKPPIVPFIIAFVGALVMAFMLAGLLGHLGPVTVRNGVVSGLFCWIGFVFPTMLVNYTFGMRGRMLLIIDSGYWLLVLVLMGAILGAMGVR
ncbi:MAG: hypothetical protein QOG83_2985 [Alphaproteobacteria bacterium]|jgi:hypothetical protein|nr:hypothetical protein [Alphaproteobacteria bacterium]MEA2990274.1 hypothetical protein [Alphaproteobacteria bacterium]